MPIINTVIQGGGTTPTGTKYITTNGVHDVTDYASADVQVPTTAPDVYIKTTSSGILKATDIIGVFGNSNINKIGIGQLVCACQGNTNITSLDSSNITEFQEYSMVSCFRGCTNLESIDFSNVTKVGKQAFCGLLLKLSNGGENFIDYGCFSKTKLKNVSFPKLSNIDTNAFGTVSAYNNPTGAFFDCKYLESVSFPAYVESYQKSACFTYAFESCTALTSFDFSSFVGTNSYSYNIFEGAFKGCTSLTTGRFESFYNDSTGQSCFKNAFMNCTSLTNLYFPAVRTTGCASGTFNNMLQGVTGCTVHFPSNTQSVISNWSSARNGFGGTNTIILYDLISTQPLTGADSNTYYRKPKYDTVTSLGWEYNSVIYYTSGTTEPTVGDTIYSDSACTTAVTTISSIA